DEVESKRREIDEKQQAFRDGQLRLNELNQQIEQHKSAVMDLMRQAAATGSKLSAVEIERKNIAAQQERLSERRQVVVGGTGSIESHRAEIQAKLDDVLASIEQQQTAMNFKRTAAAALDQQIAMIGEQLGAAREHRSGLISRQNLLQDLEAR